ncbi:hypothetical protein, partial [Gelidibacter sediminis]|uniref:hypothetical protein n=1 Tax=Gelidibacter sediminis TaxID=1608710 RepID=UPI001AAF0E3A
TKEICSTSTMPGTHLSKFNGEKACFLPQFFVVYRLFIICLSKFRWQCSIQIGFILSATIPT